MKTRIFVLLAFVVMCCSSAFAQIQVKGNISDKNSEPMIGVAIQEKGNNTNGTITDLDGNFSLSVNSNATLVVSYIGYKTQEIALNGRTNLAIVMEEDAQVLDEVVVVGYGVQRKSDLTGSVASVKSEDLKSRSTTDAAAALQGKAAGIQVLNSSGKPGQGASIRVRGYSSNSGNIGPLLIVDGLQVSSIQYLDPSLIESMEILKDAASAAIYGAEAGNGVVLITTKTGGNKGQGTITYQGKWTNQSLGMVPELLNATQFKDWMTMQLGADAVTAALKDAQDAYGWNPNTNTNWLDEYFENTWAAQHSLTFQGGNERGAYFMNLNYVNQDGIIKGNKDNYERLTAQINADYKIKDWLQVGTNTSIEKWSSRGVSENGYGTSFEMLLLIDPLTPMYWTKPEQMLGDYREYYNQIQAGNSNYTLFGDENGYYATSYFNQRLAGGNPFSQRDRSMGQNEGVNVNGTAFVNITPIKSVTFTSRLGYRLSFSNNSNWEFPYYLNGQTKGDNYMISGGSNNSTWYQWENFINYNEMFGKHAVGAMAGMSFRQSNSNGVSASASGPDILSAYAPNFIYLNCVNGNAETVKGFSGMPNMTRALSYFGRVTYSYDNRYSVQANFRADAFDSSKLSKENRWGKFFSASAGWTFSSEEFFKNLVNSDIMSFGKLRASWGQNGNQSVSNFQYYTTVGFAERDSYYFGASGGEANNDTPTTGGYFATLANPDISWETSEQINVGIDARFLNNRLGFAFDWYKKTTKDWLVRAPILGVYGIGAPYINGGNVENSGVELALTWNDALDNGFRYGISANMAYNKNEVTKLANSEGILRGPGAVLHQLEYMEVYRAEVGQPIGYFYGFKTDGIFQNQSEVEAYRANIDDQMHGSDKLMPGDVRYVDVNGDNKITDEDRTNIGDPHPDFTAGLSLTMSYKGFDFALTGAGAFGQQILRPWANQDFALQNPTKQMIYESWTGEGTSNKLPRFDSMDNINWKTMSQIWLEDADYFKIQNISLGYDFKTLMKSLPVSQLRLYVAANNVYTFTKYSGMDPEVGMEGGSGNSWAAGIDTGAYPSARTFMVGVQIKL